MKNFYKISILLCLLAGNAFPQIATTQTLASEILCTSDDIDVNDNNLIDICDADRLNIIDAEGNFGGEDGYGTVADGCRTICNGYELMNDIDFANVDNWQPITYINTTFNANGHTISNLTIDSNDEPDYLGFFREVGNEAKIVGLQLANIHIVGGNRIGALAGLNEGTITDSCIVNQDKHLKIEGQESVGGLVGDNLGGFINNSCAMVNVEGISNVGGLIGINNRKGIIINSRALGSVKGNNYGGGMIGFNHRNSVIVNSYAFGDVQAGIAGGLVGKNDKAVIVNSYASGDVTVTTMTNFIVGGGLVGQNSERGTINNSYASGSVTGAGGFAGGLAGYMTGGIIEHSYAIGEVIDTEEGDIGGLVGTIFGGGVKSSYALERGIELVGFNDIDDGSNTTASFLSDNLREPTIPDTIPTRIYYRWSRNNWDFGSNEQYPLLKYTSATDIINTPACLAADDTSTKLPRCGTLISDQQSNLIRLLELPKRAIFTPQFTPETFDYILTLSTNTTAVDFIPMPKIGDAVIRVTSDGGVVSTNEDGSTRISFEKNSDLTITVEVNAVKEPQRSTRYTVQISNKPITYSIWLRVLLEGLLR